jgi:hypothetical protein
MKSGDTSVAKAGAMAKVIVVPLELSAAPRFPAELL